MKITWIIPLFCLAACDMILEDPEDISSLSKDIVEAQIIKELPRV